MVEKLRKKVRRRMRRVRVMSSEARKKNHSFSNRVR